MAVNKNFVVKNGLEVGTDLIFANDINNTIGIGTTNVRHTLHVNGGIGVTNLVSTGIATFNSLSIFGSVAVGATSFSGLSGQYLKSTGSGVAWENFPVGRTSTSIIATAGQTVFNTAYAVGLVDIFINGVKLTPSEFVATDGVSITLADACFGGENVDILAYAVQGLGIGVTGITGLTIQDEGVLIGNPQGVTSINLVGAAVESSSSGAGVTITVSGPYWESTVAGIHTLSNVGIATTNPTQKLDIVGTARIQSDTLTQFETLLNGNTVKVQNTSSTDNLPPSINLQQARNLSNFSFGDDLGSFNYIDQSSTTKSRIGFIKDTSGSAITLSANYVAGFSGIRNGIVIRQSGNVGLGTTNPTSNLHVIGDVLVSGASTFGALTVSGTSLFTGGIQANSNIFAFGGVTGDLSGNVTSTGNNTFGNVNITGISTFSGDAIVGVGTSSGVVLTSPNGTRYRLIVADDGTLSTTAV